jgi:predicted acetyltransferase
MSDHEFQYGPAQDADIAAAAQIISLAFAGPLDSSEEWLRKAGVEHLRVLRDSAGVLLACLMRIPMGQFFGGSSMPLIGIAGVGVAPEARGRGIAGCLMAAAVQEIAAEGVPLSGLYPATLPLYRRVGYEQAGHRFEIRLPLKHIDCRDRSMPMRPIGQADRAAVQACYRAFASQFDGPLDRGAYVWNRVEQGRDVKYTGFAVIGDGGAIEGYLYLSQQRKSHRGRMDITLSDVAFTTARAGRRLLAFLEDFSSIGDDVTLFGGPMHPLLALLSEQRYHVELRDHWMLRIVNLKQALQSRAFSPRIAAELHLEIEDPLIEANRGRWILSVEAGHASVQPGGRGDLRMDIRALASLYAGYHTAEQLLLLGACEGAIAAARAAAGIFAGTTPWMSDMY